MSVAVATTMELVIDSVAAGGDGVGRSGRLVVFVPRTAPGDRVRVRLQQGKHFARGQLDALLIPSAERIEAPCPHYRVDNCGGCQLQHVRYDGQLAAKAGIVRDALARIGRRTIDEVPVRPSARQWRYRTKLTLTMRRSDGAWTMGLHPYDDPVGVFPLSDCPITDERIVGTWRAIMAAARFLPSAPALRGSVRLLDSGEQALVIDGGRKWATIDEFFTALPSVTALWWKPDGADRRIVARRGDAVAGASFGQVNATVAAELRAHLIERVAAHQPMTVVDAYAGIGETAMALARLGARVTAIERDREASAHCAARLSPPSRTIRGRVEDHLARTLPADVVLVNPPRTGVDERVAALLEAVAGALRAVAYVSCNPATLARDLGRLPSYKIASLVAFDMFPQTAHVETVCELVPRETL